MKTMLVAAVILTFSTLGRAEVAAGPDAINGSFVRMLANRPGIALTDAVDSDRRDSWFEQAVNAAIRRDMGSLDAGSANLLPSDDKSSTVSWSCGESD
jgi:hypothetical protein